MPRYSSLLSICLVALGAACSTNDQDPFKPSSSLATKDPGQYVAQGFSAALADHDMRTLLRDAFRASLWTEHKLVLQEWIKSDAGKRLVGAAVGAGYADLAGAIQRLPRTQFYAPFRSDRLSWTPDAGVVVAANFEQGSPPYGWEHGEQTLLQLNDPINRGPALFVLQRLEPIAKRRRAQGATTGAVIQDPNDGEIGGTLTIRKDGQIIKQVDLADVTSGPQLSCELFSCGGGEGGGGNHGTYVTSIQNMAVCDNVCISETLEFEFESVAQYGGSQVLVS